LTDNFNQQDPNRINKIRRTASEKANTRFIYNNNMTITTITDIKAGFVHKATAFEVDKQHPSKTELLETFQMMEENAMTVACFENECDEFGFAVLLCNDNKWKQYHADKQTEQI
jgi:hypothetical protein